MQLNKSCILFVFYVDVWKKSEDEMAGVWKNIWPGKADSSLKGLRYIVASPLVPHTGSAGSIPNPRPKLGL